jgi:hypothetical protein
MNGFYTAQWARRYKPIECTEKIELGMLTKEQAFRMENQRTLQYMSRYGVNSVRGGKFNYSGEYVHIKLLKLFFKKEEFGQLISIIIMILVILTLGAMAIL